jgi:hypothetical protein
MLTNAATVEPMLLRSLRNMFRRSSEAAMAPEWTDEEIRDLRGDLEPHGPPAEDGSCAQ